MIVCICKNINSSQVAQAIEQGATTLESLERETGLGSCCGKCRFKANGILRDSIAGVQNWQPALDQASG